MKFITLNWASAVIACVFLPALLSVQPAFADSIRARQWHLTALKASAAQKITRGEGVTVAVIDTGVKADHRDLAGNVLPGDDFIASGTKGWMDIDGHGTSMAGLIAGHGHGPGNRDGVLGIAPGAKILPIRALRDEVHGSADLPKAIDEAVRRGAGVISMSFETTNTTALEHAVENALDANVVLVAGTGNRPAQVFLQYPAKYPGVIAVGATGRDGLLAPVTVTGKEMVLTAPGVDMTSASNSGNYRSAGGTSDATAIVAGAAALVRSEFPGLSASGVVRRLTATAVDEGAPGRDSYYGFGEVNLVGALTADLPAATVPPSAMPSVAPSVGAALASVGPAVRVNWVAVAVGLGGLLVAAIVLVIWLVRRSRRRPPPRAGPGFPRTFGP